MFEKEAEDKALQEAQQEASPEAEQKATQKPEQAVTRENESGEDWNGEGSAYLAEESKVSAKEIVVAYWDPKLHHSMSCWPVICPFGVSFGALHLISWNTMFPKTWNSGYSVRERLDRSFPCVPCWSSCSSKCLIFPLLCII